MTQMPRLHAWPCCPGHPVPAGDQGDCTDGCRHHPQGPAGGGFRLRRKSSRGAPAALSRARQRHPWMEPHADPAALSLQSGTSLAMALVSRHCPEAYPGTGQVGRRPSAESASSVADFLFPWRAFQPVASV